MKRQWGRERRKGWRMGREGVSERKRERKQRERERERKIKTR